MDAVLFPYINKVGDNSRPNGAALWFGELLLLTMMPVTEHSKICSQFHKVLKYSKMFLSIHVFTLFKIKVSFNFQANP